MASKSKTKSKKKSQNKSAIKPPPGGDTPTQCDTPCLFSVSIGTQNICIATLRNDTVQVVVNENGDRLTPASICYEKAMKGQLKHLIGQVASQSADRGEENAFRYLLDLEKMCKECSRTNFQEESLKLVTDFGTQIVSHVRILGDFLSAIRENVSAYTNTPATHCIIAHSSQVTTETLRNACTRASLIPIQILHTSVFPLLAYGIGQNEKELEIRKIALVIDLGHNCLDVAIFRIFSGLIEPIKTTQFPDLGGKMFDEILTNHIVALFNDRHRCDLFENKKSILKIAREVSSVKHILSTLPSASINIDSLFNDTDCHLEIARGRFESLISPLVTRLIAVVGSTIMEAKLELTDVSDLVCVGGSCRIPFIQSQLQASFPSATFHATLPPDEVAAVGAAKQCQLLVENKLLSNLTSSPKSVPSTTHDIILKIEHDVTLFLSSTPLPATKSATFEVSGPRATFSLREGTRLIGEGVLDIPEGVRIVSLQATLNPQVGLKMDFSDTSGRDLDTFQTDFTPH